MITLSQIRLKGTKMMKTALVLAVMLSPPAAAFAAHPLITDDAGTVGKGTFQVELGFEMSDHRTDDDGVVTREDASCGTTTLSYGLLENLDVLLGMPYEKTKIKRNENETDERKDMWGGDLAGVVTVAKPLKLLANVGMKTNTGRTVATDPAFLLGGLIYSITDKIDLDLGYKRGLNKAEADNAYIVGLTMKF